MLKKFYDKVCKVWCSVAGISVGDLHKQHIINNEYYNVLHITFEIHSCWDVNYVTVACFVYKFYFQFYILILFVISMIYRPKQFH